MVNLNKVPFYSVVTLGSWTIGILHLCFKIWCDYDVSLNAFTLTISCLDLVVVRWHVSLNVVVKFVMECHVERMARIRISLMH